MTHGLFFLLEKLLHDGNVAVSVRTFLDSLTQQTY